MQQSSPSRPDWLRTTLISIALIYAIFAGLRQVNENDLGWQMATGRYILQHHQIPSTTLFNYTVPSTLWIYPLLSGITFYLLHQIAGYSAISWFSAFACAAAIALCLWRGGKLTAVLALIAVPAIAFRTVPRADLFTTILFAAFFSLLWHYYRGANIRLWLFPLLMLLWVNSHPGFVAGLALLGAYVFFETVDLLFPARRSDAFLRLRRSIPWFAATAAATLLNPWGVGIYTALSRQDNVTQQLSDFIGEWSSVHFNALALQQFLNPRDPASGDWWLMVLALLTIAVCLWRARFGPALLLSGIFYESIRHIRFQALLAILVVIIGGAMLPELAVLATKLSALRPSLQQRMRPLLAYCLLAVISFFAAVRCYDLASNKYYLDAGQTALFGAGESWWFPEKAMAFLEREHLPANLFHDYNVGGYLTFRVGETYPDFADGRFIPFAKDVFFEQRTLLAAAPDSPVWQQASRRWNINTIIFSLSRYAGLGGYPLAAFCHSNDWKPVYADDVSIIFLRDRPEYAAQLARLALNCDRLHLPLPPSAIGDSGRARAERFNFLMNSASMYYLLSRDAEAGSSLDEAASLFPNNANLHLVKAQLLQAANRTGEAEQEFRHALRLHPGDEAWFALATLYAGQHRYPEAEQCLKQSISYSQIPYERLRSLGLLYVAMNQPQQALAAFDRAAAASPFRNNSSDVAHDFNRRLADARAKASALPAAAK
ncbi:MAG TPA: tetratricopeptide repeat protein [Candidatus Acidoferrum sp.]|nr:tetratricopeptide repeat protein [Candidatus Acidoferrum sp.]